MVTSNLSIGTYLVRHGTIMGGSPYEELSLDLACAPIPGCHFSLAMNSVQR